jgi:hypothetical protein
MVLARRFRVTFEFLQASLDKRGAHPVPSFGEVKSSAWSRCMSRPLAHLTATSQLEEGHRSGRDVLLRQADCLAAQFCKAKRDFLGESAFTQKYGGGANSHGKCVSGK